MTKLSVNVNKVATLRNSRGKDIPNVLQVSLDIIRFGAHGITVHPRPDGRHIRTQDVLDLSENLKRYPQIEFNIEGYPSAEFLAMVKRVKPHQCTLVPDPPEVLTSNAGWNVQKGHTIIEATAHELKAHGIRSSFFVDPAHVSEEDLAFLRSCGADRIELYTEAYAEQFPHDPARAARPYQKVATWAGKVGLGVNAGHDLNQNNLHYFAHHVPGVLEVSIGHALISEALYDGLETTIANYLKCL